MTDQMVMKVYYLYQNLPKKTLRELKHFLTLWRKLYISQVKYMEHVGLIRNFGGGGVEILLNHCGTYMAQVE